MVTAHNHSSTLRWSFLLQRWVLPQPNECDRFSMRCAHHTQCANLVMRARVTSLGLCRGEKTAVSRATWFRNIVHGCLLLSDSSLVFLRPVLPAYIPLATSNSLPTSVSSSLIGLRLDVECIDVWRRADESCAQPPSGRFASSLFHPHVTDVQIKTTHLPEPVGRLRCPLPNSCGRDWRRLAIHHTICIRRHGFSPFLWYRKVEGEEGVE